MKYFRILSTNISGLKGFLPPFLFPPYSLYTSFKMRNKVRYLLISSRSEPYMALKEPNVNNSGAT